MDARHRVTASRGTLRGVQPRLNPAARRRWRDQTTLQFWTDPSRAVVFTGVDPAVAAFLDRLDGSRSTDQLMAEAALTGLGSVAAARILDQLDDAGLLMRGQSLPPALGRLPVAARDRMAVEIAAAAGGSARPAECIARRLDARIRLVGSGRLLLSAARLLAAAGIGTLLVAEAGPVAPREVTADGFAATDSGRPTFTVLRERLAGFVRLVDVAGDEPAEPVSTSVAVLLCADTRRTGADLVDRGVPHLWVEVHPELVRVGPFVLPGRSACANCLDLHREDRDPSWPVIAAQSAPPEPAGSLQVQLAAGRAAAEVLAFADGETPASAGATLEFRPPHWLPRRRSWAPHPACCAA